MGSNSDVPEALTPEPMLYSQLETPQILQGLSDVRGPCPHVRIHGSPVNLPAP